MLLHLPFGNCGTEVFTDRMSFPTIIIRARCFIAHSVSLWFLWLIVLLYCTYVLVYSSTATTTLHLFNSLFSSTTWASQYPKGKTSLDLNGAKDDVVLGWQWHQLDHIQTIYTSLQTDNHLITTNFYRLNALPDAQPTVSKHWRHNGFARQSRIIF